MKYNKVFFVKNDSETWNKNYLKQRACWDDTREVTVRSMTNVWPPCSRTHCLYIHVQIGNISQRQANYSHACLTTVNIYSHITKMWVCGHDCCVFSRQKLHPYNLYMRPQIKDKIHDIQIHPSKELALRSVRVWARLRLLLGGASRVGAGGAGHTLIRRRRTFPLLTLLP